eukprot:TRINITY_DN3996_c0_g1_i1.p1 TRINITY_DN3996_c0_g1~~TRINITY_DN3996_c0_g1_i1.p1  ORF type:complete len:804 (-),score=233.06 TRINITY_DN3996_c0_g1_i1:27-2411(-)
MDALKAVASSLTVPTKATRVWKNECAFSFVTQESPSGVLVDLISFVGFSPEFARLNFEKTGHSVYLNIKKIRLPIQKETPVEDKPKVLAIGIDGGFQSEEKLFQIKYSIVILPQNETIELPNSSIPQKVQDVIDAVIACDSAEKKEEVKSWTADGSLKESKYARELVQLENGKKLPLEGWRCDDCGGDASTNLWLNLTDGHIGCGRKNWDGSGGEGHALAHYDKTRFPLVVKLGTITAEGKADVHSYEEDDLVLDPFLDKHLRHWGLDIEKLTKTDKTVAELEIELQYNFDWSRVQEKSKKLVPVYGPGFTGIENLGNTCYMASVLQVLFKIPEFQKKYYDTAKETFQSAKMNAPARDFKVQMAKLAYGLLSGDYSKPPVPVPEGEEEPHVDRVRPLMFKNLVCEGHYEFSTNKQQDALEFFQYFLQYIERVERAAGGEDLSKLFQVTLEDRLECSQSHQVKYSTSTHSSIMLPIPVEKASNKEAVEAYRHREAKKTDEEKKRERENGTAEDPVWPRVTLDQCFESFSSTEVIDGWYSPVVKSNTIALKQKRFSEYPKYLVLQMGRFFLDKLEIKKLEAYVDVPDTLNIESLRGSGLKSGEVEMHETNAVKLDEEIISTIVGMGVSRTRAEHAVLNTLGQGAEAAIDWVFQQSDNPKYDLPLELKSSNKGGDKPAPPEESVLELITMGFSRAKCIKALQSTNNSMERAVDWLFSHADDVDEDESPKPTKTFDKAPGNYKLLGFVTHMGKNTQCGHYVAHVLVDGKWIIYNDSHVAESQDPPREMAYIYFYKRVD